MAKKTGKSATKSPTEITSIRHKKDTRVNIPTEELRDFVADDEKAPKAILYPRDPSLDPQLVWKGKDEQDQSDLEVPVVPIYIQEKVHPQALVENLRETAMADSKHVGDKAPELTLFSDFNGMEDSGFEKKVDFSHHDQHWSNRMILGDSLLVMTSLAEKEGLKGKVQTIYFDPPYGIKFGSNWQVSTRKRDVKDGKAEDATRQPEQVRAFRDTWKLGVHSYLAYMRDRLIDTNYNGESFFVRHAYFTGGDEPYEKLKRALRAEIDEGAWSTLYSTTSRPFAPPETGKIAVKVINHYGDEVLKVYDLATR
jgi:adenine-specific DNA-methyltransferase